MAPLALTRAPRSLTPRQKDQRRAPSALPRASRLGAAGRPKAGVLGWQAHIDGIKASLAAARCSLLATRDSGTPRSMRTLSMPSLERAWWVRNDPSSEVTGRLLEAAPRGAQLLVRVSAIQFSDPFAERRITRDQGDSTVPGRREACSMSQGAASLGSVRVRSASCASSRATSVSGQAMRSACSPLPLRHPPRSAPPHGQMLSPAPCRSRAAPR